MAREWALRGLNEDELQPDKKSEAPKTPKGKLENYWYHYKWHTIAGIASILLVILLVGQVVTTITPDYYMLIATKEYVSDNAISKIQATFERYGKDTNKDGKVKVQIDSLNFDNSDGQIAIANKTKLISHVAAADVMFFVFDKDTYDSQVVPMEKDSSRFFSPIGIQAGGIENDGLYWNWKNDPLRKNPVFVTLPDDLYFGVRSIYGTSDNKKGIKMHDENMELLRAFLEKKPLTSATTVPAPKL